MPATLASLPTEIHARIARMCTLQDERLKAAYDAIDTSSLPIAERHPAGRSTTVAALSLTSKYWNKVVEPYRFSRLTASQVASRQFRLGVGGKYGHYITTLDLSDLCSNKWMDATLVIDALLSLPNLHTIVTQAMTDVAKVVARNVERDGGSQHYGPEVSYIIDAFFRLFASVPTLVMCDLLDAENPFDRLAAESPQTRRLVLQDYEAAQPSAIIDVALDALRSCPQLDELNLVMMEELDNCEALRPFTLPSRCRLRHLSLLTYEGLTAPLSDLVSKLSPNFRSLGVDVSEFCLARGDGLAREAIFPQLETLVITRGSPAALGELTASLSPINFPVLKRLELRAHSPGNPVPEAVVTDVVATFAPRSLPLTIPVDLVWTDLRRFWIDDLPLPGTNRPGHHRHSLISEKILRDPFLSDPSLWSDPQVRPEHDDLVRYRRQALEPLLDRMRDMVHEAVQLDDYVQLTRVAKALQPCELLRVERDA